MPRPEEIVPPPYSLAAIYLAAEEFRSEHAKWGEVPVDIERIIEFGGIGLKIQPIENLKQTSGTDALLRNGDEGIIDVDYDDFNDPLCWPRLRFSLAHEVGHFVLHRQKTDVYAGVNFNTVEEWVAFLDKVPPHVHFALEQQANQFAGRLMVPIDLLAEEFASALAAKGLRKPVQLEHLELVSIGIGKRFNVSDECVLMRIDREGLNSA